MIAPGSRLDGDDRAGRDREPRAAAAGRALEQPRAGEPGLDEIAPAARDQDVDLGPRDGRSARLATAVVASRAVCAAVNTSARNAIRSPAKTCSMAPGSSGAPLRVALAAVASTYSSPCATWNRSACSGHRFTIRSS